MAPNEQTLAKLENQQQNGMEGEPVHQTRRGVEPRPPANKNEETRQLNGQTGGSQERRKGTDHLGGLGNSNGVPGCRKVVRGARENALT